MDNVHKNGTDRKKLSLLSVFRDTVRELTQIPHTTIRSFAATCGAIGLFSYMHQINHIDMNTVPYMMGAIFGSTTFMGHYNKEKLNRQEQESNPDHIFKNARTQAMQYAVTGLTVACGAAGATLGIMHDVITPTLEKLSHHADFIPFHINMHTVTVDASGLGMAGLMLHEMEKMLHKTDYINKMHHLVQTRFAAIDLIGKKAQP